MPRPGAALLAGAAVLSLLAAAVAQAADPDALWKIVSGQCVPHAQAGNPAPCAAVTPDWAVLKDINGVTQYLLIPTARIAGIESPALLAPDAPNYFAAAWQARRYVEARAGRALPRDAIALAVNPPGARSQNQLHVHVDCVRPDVRESLRGLPVGQDWTPLPVSLAGQRYQAMRLDTPALDADPFTLLADGVPGAKEAMGQCTLAVLGSADGFVLLAGRIGEDGDGHGEDLQDHACAVAQPQ